MLAGSLKRTMAVIIGETSRLAFLFGGPMNPRRMRHFECPGKIAASDFPASRDDGLFRSDRPYPVGKRIENFAHRLGVGAPRARRHMEGMIGALDTMERRRSAEPLDHELQQLQFRK